MSIRFCKECGNELEDEDVFCTNCGTKIKQTKPKTNPKKYYRSTGTQQSSYQSQPYEKKLYRSKDDRWVAGVAGGLGKYFNVDPTIIRILFIFLILGYGTGLIAYIVMALIIPEEP